MSNLTEKQVKFVQGMASGMKQVQAALVAGYSPASAKAQSSQLMARADIKAAIRAAKKAQGKKEPEGTDNDERTAWLKDRYDSPLDLLEDVYNNPRIPFALRFESAKQAMPYRHGRVGEAGKKEKKQERASEIAGGNDSAGKFGTRQPPKLNVVK